MSFRDSRFWLAGLCLITLGSIPMVAAEFSTSSSASLKFRTAGLSHEILLRESSSLQTPAEIALPPGGQELNLQPASTTPYDRYFGSVRAVIATLDSQRSTMATACHLMKVGYSFQYTTRDPYHPDPPKLTEAQHAGDCKSKALWLYENLADSGALFVIGKAEKSSRTSHAWVYWRSGGRWWILDCTDRLDPIAADSVSSGRYIPYYSFGKTGTYRHPAAQSGAPTADVTGMAGDASARRNAR